MSGAAGPLDVPVNRRMPAPKTSTAVAEALTPRFKVPELSTTAAAPAMFSGLLAEKVVVGSASVATFTVVVPV